MNHQPLLADLSTDLPQAVRDKLAMRKELRAQLR